MEENTQKRSHRGQRAQAASKKKEYLKNPTEIITNPSEHSLFIFTLDEV
jgi:hypothetical protein